MSITPRATLAALLVAALLPGCAYLRPVDEEHLEIVREDQRRQEQERILEQHREAHEQAMRMAEEAAKLAEPAPVPR